MMVILPQFAPFYTNLGPKSLAPISIVPDLRLCSRFGLVGWNRKVWLFGLESLIWAWSGYLDQVDLVSVCARGPDMTF